MASSPTKSATGVSTSGMPNTKSGPSDVEDQHFEESFRGFLGSLKHTILSCTHPNFGTDERAVLRAQELVKEEIRKSLFQLSTTTAQQPTYTHRVTAFSYVGSKLLAEVEEMQNCSTLSNKVDTLMSEKEKLKKFYQQRETELNTTMAILEKRNAELLVQNQHLEAQNATLDHKATDTQRELNIRNNMDEDTNNKYVKLHMDIMTHHSRVNTKVEESLRSIKAKVGFVPREVEEHLKELQNIQPPGVDLVFSVMASTPSAASPVRKKQRRAVPGSKARQQTSCAAPRQQES